MNMEIVKLHHFANHINLHNFTFSLASRGSEERRSTSRGLHMCKIKKVINKKNNDSECYVAILSVPHIRYKKKLA